MRLPCVALLGTGMMTSGCKNNQPPVQTLPPGVQVTRPIVLTDAARIPESDPAVSDVEVRPDRLLFKLRSRPTIALAAGHVVAGAKGGGYLRRITSVVSATDAVMEVATQPAVLVDLIKDGAFRVGSEALDNPWAQAIGMVRQPVEAKVRVFPLAPYSGLPCGGDAFGQNIELKPSLDFDLDAEFELDIRFRPGLGVSNLSHALFALKGFLEVGADVKILDTVSGGCSFDLVQWLRDRLGPNPLGGKRFHYEVEQVVTLPTVPPFPLLVKHEIDPVFNVAFELQSVQAGVEEKGSERFSIRVGAEYYNGAWRGIWEPVRESASLEPTLPEDVGEFSFAVASTVGVQYKGLVWATAGPKFSLERKDEAKVTTSSTPPGCPWTGTLETSWNAVLGAELAIPLIDRTLVDFTASFALNKERQATLMGRLRRCDADGGVRDGGPGGGGDGGSGEIDPTHRIWSQHDLTTLVTQSGSTIWERRDLTGTINESGYQVTIVGQSRGGPPTTLVCTLPAMGAGSCTFTNQLGEMETYPWNPQSTLHLEPNSGRDGWCPGAGPAVWNDGSLYTWQDGTAEERFVYEYRLTDSWYRNQNHPTGCVCEPQGMPVRYVMRCP